MRAEELALLREAAVEWDERQIRCTAIHFLAWVAEHSGVSVTRHAHPFPIAEVLAMELDVSRSTAYRLLARYHGRASRVRQHVRQSRLRQAAIDDLVAAGRTVTAARKHVERQRRASNGAVSARP